MPRFFHFPSAQSFACVTNIPRIEEGESLDPPSISIPQIYCLLLSRIRHAPSPSESRLFTHHSSTSFQLHTIRKVGLCY